MIKVSDIGTLAERLAKITQSINRSSVIFPFSVFNDATLTVDTTGVILGGCQVDQTWLRTVASTAKWKVRAAGWIAPTDANGATVSIYYTSNTAVNTLLGSAVYTGAGVTKAVLGPFNVFGPAPMNESVVSIRVEFKKNTSGTATLYPPWTLWLELLSSAF